MGPVQPDDEVLVVGLGTRVDPLRLRRRLTTGRLIVVDVYNPQWTTSQVLVRLRKQAPHPPSDPRLVWQDGRFDLFPLPDNSVPFVLLNQTLSEFWQEGDRLRLLQEIHRVLTANGRLLFAERMRTQTNWLVLGPTAVRLAGHDYWQTLLQEAGFVIRREQNLQGLITCIRAEKPSATEARQLALDIPL
jgi:ubiquinone/menaquinone biosynthesis C-methylase UbiE